MTRRALLLLLAALAAASCSRKPPAEKLVADLEEHVEDLDANGLAGKLAPDFRAATGMTRADAIGELKRYFFAYESLDITVSDIVADGPPPTKVSFRVDMSGKPKQVGGLAALLPSVSAWRFELYLTPSGDLLIQSARWERVDRPMP